MHGLTRRATALGAALVFAFSASMSAGDGGLTLDTIVIDAGHGGKDAGAVSHDKKTYEKTLTLKISKMLAERISDAYPEMNVILTRSSDVFVPLGDRASAASKAGAKLFISVHINASARSSEVNGFSAYILGQSSSRRYDSYDVNLEIVRRENSVIYLEDDYSTKYGDFDSGPESQIMLRLLQNAYREQSLSFAEKVAAHVGDKGPFVKNWGVMQGNFAVLREASMPAVLLEYGFITNPSDLAQLRAHGSIETLVARTFDAFVEYKREYDASVSLGRDSLDKGRGVAGEGAGVPAGGAVAATPETRWGTQVLAGSRELRQGDPVFKGNEFVVIRSGNVLKYVIGVSGDKAAAAAEYRRLKAEFKDAFFVKITGDSRTEAERP